MAVRTFALAARRIEGTAFAGEVTRRTWPSSLYPGSSGTRPLSGNGINTVVVCSASSAPSSRLASTRAALLAATPWPAAKRRLLRNCANWRSFGPTFVKRRQLRRDHRAVAFVKKRGRSQCSDRESRLWRTRSSSRYKMNSVSEYLRGRTLRAYLAAR